MKMPDGKDGKVFLVWWVKKAQKLLMNIHVCVCVCVCVGYFNVVTHSPGQFRFLDRGSL